MEKEVGQIFDQEDDPILDEKDDLMERGEGRCGRGRGEGEKESLWYRLSSELSSGRRRR